MFLLIHADVDFRIEGDTDANLIFADASTDRVAIGDAAPLEKLHVEQGNFIVNKTGAGRGNGAVDADSGIIHPPIHAIKITIGLIESEGFGDVENAIKLGEL